MDKQDLLTINNKKHTSEDLREESNSKLPDNNDITISQNIEKKLELKRFGHTFTLCIKCYLYFLII